MTKVFVLIIALLSASGDYSELLAKDRTGFRQEIQGDDVSIPSAAYQHSRTLISEVRYYHGLNGPVSLHAAMIHQESRWDPNAESPVGAKGLAQFMPATANWMPDIDKRISSVDTVNAKWSIRAMASYTSWIIKRVEASDRCEEWAKTLSSYNGGIGWLGRDEKLTREKGYDPSSWFSGVSKFSKRSDSAFKENRHYVRTIIFEIQPAYSRSVEFGYGRSVCLEL